MNFDNRTTLIYDLFDDFNQVFKKDIEKVQRNFVKLNIQVKRWQVLLKDQNHMSPEVMHVYYVIVRMCASLFCNGCCQTWAIMLSNTCKDKGTLFSIGAKLPVYINLNNLDVDN